MKQDDRELAQRVKQSAGADSPPPAFEALWSRAENEYRSSRRRYARAATAAAAVAVVVVVMSLATAPHEQTSYIEMAELLNSTSWSAPSDVLMPEHQFDIYEDLPTLTRSTKPAEGALL